MLRRQARERREYMLKRAAEAKEAASAERKRKLRDAVTAGKPVPTELRPEADEIMAEIELDGVPRTAASASDPTADVDSEYANAGVSDPRILLTTSHDPSSKLVQFVKEMKLVFPNCERMNRGGHTVKEIVETARADGFTDLVVLQEHRGVPDGLVVTHLPYGPTAYFGLVNVTMRHDIEGATNMSEAYPHLVLHNLTTKIGARVGAILKHLFPVPKPDSKRVISFINQADLIAFRHHVYSKEKANVHLYEVGPRFDLRLYQIKLGTIDQEEVENEWVLRPYMNTASKRRVLAR